MSDDSTLTINLNEEYKIKIETGNEFKKSIFKEVYDAALKNVEEITKQSSPDNMYDDFNNIIAFTGERGKGKSSSMISFRDALIGHKDEKHKEFFNGNNNIISKKFATIDIVDPSLFRGEESLFEIILAQMFQKFQQKIQVNSKNLNDDNRRIIIKQFQEVFENLQIIKNRNDLYKKDSIEALSRLATSSNLRTCFKKLVEVYLNKFENNFDFLVIAIDDFDLNISGAYEMLEDIRQYLIQSNIILLIACKTEQLKQIVLCNYFKCYEILIKNKTSHLDIEDLVNKTEKYLEKLIPQHRNLILPNVLIAQNKVITFIGEIEELNGINIKEIEKVDYKSLKEKLLAEHKIFINNSPSNLIFEAIYKINNFFINSPEYRQNSIIPDTLRGFIDLISTLNANNSLEKFRNYILELAYNRLDVKYKTIFKTLENQKEDTLNLALVNSIYNLEIFFTKDTKEKEIKEILNSKNPLNVTIGDVYTVLNRLYRDLNYTDKNQQLFIDLLNIYYSLRLKHSSDIKSLAPNFYTSEDFKVFKSRQHGQRRDFIKFNKIDVKELFDEIHNKEYKLWFIHFFMFLGKVETDYRKELDNPFFKSIQGVNQGVFSPLVIFSNILNVERLAEQIRLTEYKNTKLYMDIQSWNRGEYCLYEVDSYTNENGKTITNNEIFTINNLNMLLKNSMFYIELMSFWEDEINKYHKEGVERTDDGEEIIFNTIANYFTICLEKALSRMSKKYTYIDINPKLWVENHPVIRRFNDMKSMNEYKLFQNIFNKLYSPNLDTKIYQHVDVELAKQFLKDYNKYLLFEEDILKDKKTLRGEITRYNKKFSDQDIQDKISSFRKEMTKDTNLISGFKKITDFLTDISNG